MQVENFMEIVLRTDTTRYSRIRPDIPETL